MPTVLLNQSNNFRANVTATVTNITFLVKGASADCEVRMPPTGAPVATAMGVTAGNVAKLTIAAPGAIRVQANPMNAVLGNITVSY